jgi:hypothetical protein
MDISSSTTTSYNTAAESSDDVKPEETSSIMLEQAAAEEEAAQQQQDVPSDPYEALTVDSSTDLNASPTSNEGQTDEEMLHAALQGEQEQEPMQDASPSPLPQQEQEQQGEQPSSPAPSSEQQEEKTVDDIIQELLATSAVTSAAAAVTPPPQAEPQLPHSSPTKVRPVKKRKPTPEEDLYASLQNTKKLATEEALMEQQQQVPLEITELLTGSNVDFHDLKLKVIQFTHVDKFPIIKMSKHKRDGSLEEKLQALFKLTKEVEGLYYMLATQQFAKKPEVEHLLAKLFEALVLADHLQSELEVVSELNMHALTLTKQFAAFLTDILHNLKNEPNLSKFVVEWLQKSFENFNADQQRLIEQTLELSLQPSAQQQPTVEVEDDEITQPQSVLVFLASIASFPSYLIHNDFQSMSSQGRYFVIDPVFLKFYEDLSTQQKLQFIKDFDAISRYTKMTEPVLLNTPVKPPTDDDDTVSVSKFLAPVSKSELCQFMDSFDAAVMNKEYFLNVVCKKDNLFYDFVLNGPFMSLTSQDRDELLRSQDADKQKIAQFNSDDAFMKLSKFVYETYDVEIDSEVSPCVEDAAKKVSNLTYELTRSSQYNRAKLEMNITKKLHSILDKLLQNVLETDYRNKLDDKVLSLAIKYVNNQSPSETKVIIEKVRLNPRSVISADQQSLLDTLRTAWLNNENDLQGQVLQFDSFLYSNPKTKTRLPQMSKDELLEVLNKYHSDNLETGKLSTNTRDFLRQYLRLFGNFNSLPRKNERTFTKMTDLDDLPAFLSASMDLFGHESDKHDYSELIKSNNLGVVTLLHQYLLANLQQQQSNELLQRLRDEVAKLHLSTYIDVPFVMEQAEQNNFRYLDEAMARAGVSDIEAQRYRLAVRARDGKLIEKLQRLLAQFSSSENERVLRKLSTTVLPLYRAAAVYNRQPVSVNKSLYVINPLVTDKSFQKRRQRREFLLRPDQLLARSLMTPSVGEIDINIYKTKPWMKFDNKYKWYITPVQQGASLPKEKLQRTDAHIAFFGGQLDGVLYSPTDAFWQWYSKQVGTEAVREFDESCSATEKFSSLFFGPKRRFNMGLYNEEKRDIVPLTLEDLRQECLYFQRVMQPMDAFVVSLMASLDKASTDLKNLDDKMKQAAVPVLEKIKQNYKQYNLMNIDGFASTFVKSYIQYALDNKLTLGQMLTRYLTMLFVLNSNQPVYLLTNLRKPNFIQLLPSMDLVDMMPVILMIPAAVKHNLQDVIEAEVLKQAWDMLISVHLASQQSGAYAKAVIDASRMNTKKLGDVFLSVHKNQYKNLCSNEVQGPIVFYYTSKVDQKLYCAGFEEVNKIVSTSSNDPSLVGVPGLSSEAIQHIRSKFSAGNDFGSQLKEITEQIRGHASDLDNALVRSLRRWNDLKRDMHINDIDLSDDKKHPDLVPLFEIVVRKMNITDPVLANLAADHLATLIHNEVMSNTIDVLQKLLLNTVSWPSFALFLREYKEEAEVRSLNYAKKCTELKSSNDTENYNRCLQEQELVSRNDRLERQKLFSKNINGGESLLGFIGKEVPYFDTYVTIDLIDELIDYLTLTLDLPNVATDARLQTCDGKNCTNVLADFSSVVMSSSGTKMKHTCKQLDCFSSMLAEDKLPPISLTDIHSSEITNNVVQLFAPMYTDADLRKLAVRFGVSTPLTNEENADVMILYPKMLELWNQLVLTFNPEVFNDDFIESRGANIDWLFQFFIMNPAERSNSGDLVMFRSLSTGQRLQMLLQNSEFRERVQRILMLRQPESEDVMNLVEQLVQPWHETSQVQPDDTTSMFAQQVRRFVDESKYDNKELYQAANPTQLLHFLINNNFKGWDSQKGRLPHSVIQDRTKVINDLFVEYMVKRAPTQRDHALYVKITDPNEQLDKLFKYSDKFQEALKKKLKLILEEDDDSDEDDDEDAKQQQQVVLNSPFLPGCTQVSSGTARAWMENYVKDRLLNNVQLSTMLYDDRRDRFDEVFKIKRDDSGKYQSTTFDFLDVVSDFGADFPTEPCLKYDDKVESDLRAYKEIEAAFKVFGLVSFGVYKDAESVKVWPHLLRKMFAGSPADDDVVRIVLYLCSDAMKNYLRSGNDQQLALDVLRVGQTLQAQKRYPWQSNELGNPKRAFKVVWSQPEYWSRSVNEERLNRAMQDAFEGDNLTTLISLAKEADVPTNRIKTLFLEDQKAKVARNQGDPLAKSMTQQVEQEKKELTMELLTNLSLSPAGSEKVQQKMRSIDSMWQHMMAFLRYANVRQSDLMFYRGSGEQHHSMYKRRTVEIEEMKKRGEDPNKVAYLILIQLREYHSLDLGLVMKALTSEDLKKNLLDVRGKLAEAEQKLQATTSGSTLGIQQRITVLKQRVKSIEFLLTMKRNVYMAQLASHQQNMIFVPTFLSMIPIQPPVGTTRNNLVSKLFKVFFDVVQESRPGVVTDASLQSVKDLRSFMRSVQDDLSSTTEGAVAGGCVDERGKLSYKFDLSLPMREIIPKEMTEEEELESYYAAAGSEEAAAKLPPSSEQLVEEIQYEDVQGQHAQCERAVSVDEDEEVMMDEEQDDEEGSKMQDDYGDEPRRAPAKKNIV